MSLISSVVDQVLTLHGAPAYTLVGGLAFAEAAVFVGFVLPGETAVLLGGVLAHQPKVSLTAMAAVARFIAFLRAVMPGLAGTVRVPYRRFLAFNAAGGLIWALGFTMLGYAAGASYKKVESVAGRVSEIILAVVVVVVVVLVLIHRRRDRDTDSYEPHHLA